MTYISKARNWRSSLTRRTGYNPEYGLSGTWRIRRSMVPEVEFKYIQEAVQSFVDVLTSSTGRGYRVIWKGQDRIPAFTSADKDRPIITLSYGPIKDALGSVPVDPEIVDIVTGLAIHEAGHAILNEIRGKNQLHGLIGNILEDAYIDMGSVRDNPVLGAYINRMRQYYRDPAIDAHMKRRFEDPRRFRREEVIAAWQAYILEECDPVMDGAASRVRDNISDDARPLSQCLEGLLKITVKAVEPNALGRDYKNYQAIMRGAMRVLDKYEAEIDDLAAPQQPSPWQSLPATGTGTHGSPDPRSSGQVDEDEDAGDEEHEGGGSQAEGEDSHGDEGTESGSSEGDDEGEGSGSKGGSGQPDSHSHLPGHGESSPPSDPDHHDYVEILPTTCRDELMEEMPADLAERTFDMMEHEAEDVSQVAGSSFIMKKPYSSVPVKTDSNVAEGIRQAFETRRHHSTLDIPFQESGRISRRTLPRYWMGKKDLFEETEIEDEIDVAMGLLIDCSSSITTRGSWTSDGRYSFEEKGQWEIIMEISQVMAEAFDESQLDLYIMAYSSGVIWRLYEPGFDKIRLGGVHPANMTPSIPAMKVMAHKIMTESVNRKDRLIVHLTDGLPNEGGGPENMRSLVSELERQNLKTIGIGIGVPTDTLAQQYDRHFTVHDVEDVPGHLRRILERL
jgi:hypothetical protein